jgi:aspartate kinase
MATRSRSPLHVLKFGGTSLGAAERVAWAARHAAGCTRRRRTLVVVSAMAGITNLLLRSARAAATGDRNWRKAADEIRERHAQAAESLLSAAERKRFAQQMEEAIATLERNCARFEEERKATAEGLDRIASLGEVISAALFAAALRETGARARAVDAAELIVTDDRFGDANVMVEATQKRLRERIAPLLARGVVPVITGFRGAAIEGAPTTLGRGSSDYTATLVGSLLGAAEITIWTDVDGVMTADPQLVPGARVISRLTYAEAIELAFFGAKVIHWKAILPAMQSQTPLRVRNSFRPRAAGTRIVPGASGRTAVAAVTAVPRAHLVTLRGDGGLRPVELAARALGWLAGAGAHPLLVVHSSPENSLAFALGHEEATLAGFCHPISAREASDGFVVHSSEEVGLVTAIGARIGHPSGAAARIFTALERSRVTVLAAATGPSSQRVALAVPQNSLGAAVRAIHREFRL